MLAVFADPISQAVVDDGGGEESQGAVVVLVVVPGEEDVPEGAAVGDERPRTASATPSFVGW